MHSLAARRTRAGLATALAVGALSSPALAHADENTGYTYLTTAPTRPIPFVTPDGSTKSLRPTFAALDSDDDGRPDLWTYCIEPTVPVNQKVINGQVKLFPYSSERYHIADPGRLAWVLEHGATNSTFKKVAAEAGVTTAGLSDDALRRAMIDATGAAVWRLSAGYKVAQNAPYEGSPAAGAAFHRAVDYFVASATPETDKKLVVLDSQPGEDPTQALVIISSGPKPMPVPVPVPTPTPTPTKTETPAPTPTKTETPAPTPTKTETPAPTPTKTETPAPTPTKTETPAPAPTTTTAPAPAPTSSTTAAPAPTTQAPQPTDSPSPVVINSGLAPGDTGPNRTGIVLGGIGLLVAVGGIVVALRRNARS